MDMIKYLYRTGLVGFLAGGAIGSLNTGTNDAAVFVANNAVGNAFQGGGVGLIVGFALAMAGRRTHKSMVRQG